MLYWLLIILSVLIVAYIIYEFSLSDKKKNNKESDHHNFTFKI